MHIYIMSIIGENIRKYRKSKGLTQTQLAEKMDTTQYVLTNYERGVNNPPAAKMPEIAKVLDVSLDELYGIKSGEKKEPAPKSSVKRRDAQMQKIFEDLPSTDQRALLKQAKALSAHKSNPANKKTS